MPTIRNLPIHARNIIYLFMLSFATCIKKLYYTHEIRDLHTSMQCRHIMYNFRLFSLLNRGSRFEICHHMIGTAYIEGINICILDHGSMFQKQDLNDPMIDYHGISPRSLSKIGIPSTRHAHATCKLTSTVWNQFHCLESPNGTYRRIFWQSAPPSFIA